jgi:hypothetical protein
MLPIAAKREKRGSNICLFLSLRPKLARVTARGRPVRVIKLPLVFRLIGGIYRRVSHPSSRRFHANPGLYEPGYFSESGAVINRRPSFVGPACDHLEQRGCVTPMRHPGFVCYQVKRGCYPGFWGCKGHDRASAAESASANRANLIESIVLLKFCSALIVQLVRTANQCKPSTSTDG